MLPTEPAPTPVLELGDDRVFVRPPTAEERRELDVGLAALQSTARVLTGFMVVLLLCLIAWPGVLIALATLGVLAATVVAWCRVGEWRRDRAGEVLEVRSARRTLRVLGSGHLFFPGLVDEVEAD